jgi:uncharacterized protein
MTAESTVDNLPARRYEWYEGEDLAGFLRYHLDGDRIDLLHTEVAAGFEGRGIGSRLARHALDEARRRHRTVIPSCPFVRGWIAKHPDYLDLVPGPERARFHL